MNTPDGTESPGTGNAGGGAIRSLRDLPRDIAPPRDLWPSIAAQLDSKPDVEDSGSGSGAGPHRFRFPTWLAAAAMIAALAVGMWLGRSVLPSAGGEQTQTAPTVASDTNTPATNGATPAAGTPIGADGAQQVFVSAYITDPRYNMKRAAMVKDLETRLKALPPDTQVKVAASLTTIRASMKEIETALGLDPANALLQEMLINTYQDEMRVLTAVNEASSAGRGL